MIDRVVHRKDMRATLARILSVLIGQDAELPYETERVNV